MMKEGERGITIDCQTKDYTSFTIHNFNQNFPNYPIIDYKKILLANSNSSNNSTCSKDKGSEAVGGGVSNSSTTKTSSLPVTKPGETIIASKKIRELKDNKEVRNANEISKNNDEEKNTSIDLNDGYVSKDVDETKEKNANDEDTEKHDRVKDFSSPNLPLKRKAYDNIIERLERKYCGSTLTQNSESTDDEDEDEEIDEEEEDATAPTTTLSTTLTKTPIATTPTNAAVPPLKRKKKTLLSNYYDMDDPFIDDSDNITTVETQMKMNKMQTVHDGYFISSGTLEMNTNMTLKLVTELQFEEAMTTISTNFDDLSMKLKSILQQITNLKSNNDLNILKKSFPSSVLTELSDLDTIALSHEVDLLRLITKLKSPYRIWIQYLFQIVSKSCGEELTEERMEIFLQMFKKIILKKRNTVSTPTSSSGTSSSNSGSGNGGVNEAAPSVSLRQLLNQKVQEVGIKIRSKIEEKSQEDKIKEVTDPNQEKDEEKSQIAYQWICKWDMALRGQVYELELLCRQWVENENNLRQALASSDKKKKTEETLSQNNEITKILTQLCGIAFAPPYTEDTVEKGGMSGIKRALLTEKTRVKNREKRNNEKSVVDVDGTTSVENSNSTENTETTAAKKEKKNIPTAPVPAPVPVPAPAK